MVRTRAVTVTHEMDGAITAWGDASALSHLDQLASFVGVTDRRFKASLVTTYMPRSLTAVTILKAS